MLKILSFLFLLFLFFPQKTFAADQDLIINEVIYDFVGNDEGHEWVELLNIGTDPVTIIGGSTSSSWRINDGSNHLLDSSPYQGSMTIASGEFIIIAQDPQTFLTDNSGFSGNIIKSSALSLGNNTATVALRIGSAGLIWGEFSYQKSQGANGDGNSLQRKLDSIIAAVPTPGKTNSTESAPSASPSPSVSLTPTPTTNPTSTPTPTPTKTPTPAPHATSISFDFGTRFSTEESVLGSESAVKKPVQTTKPEVKTLGQSENILQKAFIILGILSIITSVIIFGRQWIKQFLQKA